MTSYRPRLWLGLGLSVLSSGVALPARAADDACLKPASGDAGEAGESGGEGAADTPDGRVLLLDRMAAQIAGAAETRAAGDAASADILVGAATDEGPARLARGAGKPDPALEAALAPLAGAPADPAAASAARRAIETALTAANPEAGDPDERVERAGRLAALALDSFLAGQDCGRLTDRAAYAEARALIGRARKLLLGLQLPAAAEAAGSLDRLAALLPPSPPDPLPQPGLVSALVSRALLAVSDVAH